MINNLSSYIDKINSILIGWKFSHSTYFPWFRGEEDEDWELKPSIYRTHNINYYERELIRDFKNQAYSLLSNNFPKNEFEWLFYMQHYGLPTRLLDFTESSLVALYFAVQNYKNDKNAKVWILDPMSLNKVTIEQQYMPYFNNPILKDYFIDEPILKENFTENTDFNVKRQVSAELPIAVRPIRNSVRSIAQKGTFVVFGKKYDSLENIISEQRQNNMKRVDLEFITIDGKSKLSLLKELAICGITNSVIFPEVGGIAAEIKQNLSEDFVGKIGKKEFIELKK